MNGISKKFCILTLAFSQLSALAAMAVKAGESPFPYACLITGCFVSYLIVRFFGKDK